MGIKLRQEMNAIPVTCSGGILKYEIGKETYEFWVPGIDKYIDITEPQCNHFRGKNVMALLKGEIYSMVLRFDGTGCIFTSKDQVLVKSFIFPYKPVEKCSSIGGGTYTEFHGIKPPSHMPIDLFSLDDKNYIMSCNSPMSFSFAAEDNIQYFKDRKFGLNVAYPELGIINGELCSISTDNKKIYALKGKLSEGNAFISF